VVWVYRYVTEAGGTYEGSSGSFPRCGGATIAASTRGHHHDCPQLMRDDILYECIGNGGSAINMLDGSRILNSLYDSA
jgi:hypothetical protein